MKRTKTWPVLILVTLLGVAISLLGEGAGQPEATAPIRFTEHLLKDKYGYAFGVVAADLDGDGHLDVTSCDTVNDTLYWFANDGKGGFTRHTICEKEAGWLERHAVGDIDGDGRPDVVIVKNLAKELIWFQNPKEPRAEKNWQRHLITRDFARAYDVALADLAGAGRLDVAASAWNGNQLAWFENNGKHGSGKEWKKHVIDAKAAESRTIRAADFNRDGKIDLLATASSANLTAWYENPGKPGLPWKKHVIDGQSPRPIHGHPIDMDGDGDLDVVMALGMLLPPGTKDTNQIVWYENVGKPGKGSQWKKHVIGQLEGAFEAVAADLNGDGHLDVVATAWGRKGKLVWFENPADPKKTPWKMHVLKDPWVNANQVIVADLNKDGRPDIVASAERGSNELRWWRNEGPPKK